MFDDFFARLTDTVIAAINVIVEILNRVISLMIDMVGWFQKKYKGLRRYVVYIMTTKRLTDVVRNMPNAQDIIKNAKTLKVPGLYGDDAKFSEGVAQVVLDTETDRITDLRMLGGEGIDDGIKAVMRGTEIVQLA